MKQTYVTQRSTQHQRGAVAIFVVIFSALLVTIVTVGFVQVMLKGQQEAQTIDLSQSAYDSALAGVEDAKRAVALATTNSTIQDVLDEGSGANCQELSVALDGGADPARTETKIETSEGDAALNQAYTCLKVSPDTDSYEGSLSLPESQQLIPLKVTSGSVKSVQIQWFTTEDISSEDGTIPQITPRSVGDKLPAKTSETWSASTPPVVDAQLIQFGNATLGEFDSNDGTRSNTNTLSLYPASTGLPNFSFISDVRRSGSAALKPVTCQASPVDVDDWGNYSCKVTSEIPESRGSNPVVFLRLATHYNGAHYRVTLYDGTTQLRFDGVQPQVDSTGRANDVFRRVSARITRSIGQIYPDAAVDTNSSFCKTFVITNDADDYDPGACTP